MVNALVLISQPMNVMTSCSVPSAASFWSERTSERGRGSLSASGWNMRWIASGSAAIAHSMICGVSSATVMPSSMFPSVFASGALCIMSLHGRAWPNGVSCGSRIGGGM
eukprot:15243251-Ditylum_brightwellii.AAC.1